MKRLLALFLVAISFYSNAEPCISFSDETFCEAWSGNARGFKSFEYLRKKESTQRWTKMLAFRSYEAKSDVEKVVSGFLNSIKSMAAIKPDILSPEESDYEDETIVLVLLIAPDKSYYEYIIHRFIKDSDDIYSGFYSYRMPYAAKPNFNEIAKNRNAWIKQILAMDFKQHMGH